MKRRTKNTIKEWAASIALFSLIIAALVWLPESIERGDCGRATRALKFYERCEANENCKLRPADLERREMHLRISLQSCPEGEPR